MEQIRTLLLSYVAKPSKNLRDQIYDKTYVIIWRALKKCCHSYNLPLSEQDKISYGWDSFLFCLKSWNEDTKPSKHFYVYSWFFMQNLISKIRLQENRCTLFIESVHGKDTKHPNPEQSLLFTEINDTMSLIPSEDKPIFEDALFNIIDGHKTARVTDIKCTKYEYKQKKKKYKKIINKILKSFPHKVP